MPRESSKLVTALCNQRDIGVYKCIRIITNAITDVRSLNVIECDSKVMGFESTSEKNCIVLDDNSVTTSCLFLSFV